MKTGSYRIKHALHHRTWAPGLEKEQLEHEGEPVTPSDYDSSMKGHIFCPRCWTPLCRRPNEGAWMKNRRPASFAHLPSYGDTPCPLRSLVADGELFRTETEARMAVQRGDLVVVSEFLAEEPSADLHSGVYDQSQVATAAGPISTVPLRRHSGENFALPARHSTVKALCTNFEANLSRFYLLPGQAEPQRLEDLLVPATTITEPSDEPRLYWGVITSSVNMGQRSQMRHHLRMTYLSSGQGIKDLCLKEKDGPQQDKGIDDASVGRILLVWSKVTWNGIGLCFDSPGWGTYALLPSKYDSLLRRP